MTEEEAKTKWCPFVRTMLYQPEGNANPPVNRDTHALTCIGSACMAWRSHNTNARPPEGWCGLAGES